MQISSIAVQNRPTRSKAQKQSHPQKNNIAFKGIVTDVAKDSHSKEVLKTFNHFIDFMKETVTKAANNDGKSKKLLQNLIGKPASDAITKDVNAFTKEADKSTKAIPLSGLGKRGAPIRNAITDTLGKPQTHKATLPLPAVLGEHKGEKVYLNTVNAEVLNMMKAKTLSPFEKLDVIKSDESKGDLTVIVKGLEEEVIPTDKPVLFTYTDDISTNGHKDYANLLAAANKEPKDSKVKIISAGFEATKKETEGKLGAFFPNGDGSFRVVEKPSMEQLNEALGEGDKKVFTNVGKTLFMPEGLKDIKQRNATKPESLMKKDKDKAGNDVLRYHNTVGALGPAGEEGTLKVIPKRGKFADVGNGTEFTDQLVKFTTGENKGFFPNMAEKQLAKNVEVAKDGTQATLKYGDKKVTLKTSAGEEGKVASKETNKENKSDKKENKGLIRTFISAALGGVTGGAIGAAAVTNANNKKED